MTISPSYISKRNLPARAGSIDNFIICTIIVFSIVRNPLSYHFIIASTFSMAILMVISRRRIRIDFMRGMLIIFMSILMIFLFISYMSTSSYIAFGDLFLFRVGVFYPFFLLFLTFYNNEEILYIIERSLFISLTILVLIAMMEIVFDFSMLKITGRSDDTVVANLVAEDRFLATSIYGNYNDLMFSISIYNALIIGRAINTKSYSKIFYIIISIVLFFYQIYVGSRASIFGTLLSYIIVFFYYRERYKKLFFSIIIISIFNSIILFYYIYNYVVNLTINSDNKSDLERYRIYMDSISALVSNLRTFIFGFGSKEDFYSAVHDICGYECLANPHNIIIEIIYSYGFFAIIIYFYFYMYFLILFLRRKIEGFGFGLALGFLIIPISGLGPSSSLDIYIHWWILISAACMISLSPKQKII